MSPTVQVARVLRGAHPGAILDLHDAEGTRGAPARLIEALPRMMDEVHAAGYAFTTVGELFTPTGALERAPTPVHPSYGRDVPVSSS